MIMILCSLSTTELFAMVSKIKTTPLKGAVIEAELCPIEDEEESCKMVTLKLSALPRGITKKQVETYFETQGDSVEVISTELQGPGNATIVLSGMTAEGMIVTCTEKGSVYCLC